MHYTGDRIVTHAGVDSVVHRYLVGAVLFASSQHCRHSVVPQCLLAEPPVALLHYGPLTSRHALCCALQVSVHFLGEQKEDVHTLFSVHHANVPTQFSGCHANVHTPVSVCHANVPCRCLRTYIGSRRRTCTHLFLFIIVPTQFSGCHANVHTPVSVCHANVPCRCLRTYIGSRRRTCTHLFLFIIVHTQ
jgi:hypothetical protein